MRAVLDEVDGANARAEQEGERRLVSFDHVAAGARQYEVVAAVVRRLAASRCDMVERHDGRGELHSAIRADRTMLGQEPSPRLDVGVSAGRMRRQLDSGAGGATATAAATCLRASRRFDCAIMRRVVCVRCACRSRPVNGGGLSGGSIGGTSRRSGC
jgi:hypothetical protein